MKTILKIVAIVAFFTATTYALTYPYELSYKGTEDIKLIEESYEYTSLDEVINRPEFKDKVLFIRVGYPFDIETNLPGDKYIENQIILLDDEKKHIIHSEEEPFKYQLQVLSEMRDRYKNKDIEFVFLHINHDKSNQQIDNIRNWKAFIKKYPVKGNHLLMSTTLYNKMRDWKRSGKGKFIFPYNIIVDKQGDIVNNNTPSPIFEKERLYKELDSILKQ